MYDDWRVLAAHKFTYTKTLIRTYGTVLDQSPTWNQATNTDSFLSVMLALAKEGLSKWKTYKQTLATGSVCGIVAHTWHWALERLSKGPRVWVACASALITPGRWLCRCQTRLWSWKFRPFLVGSSGPPAPVPLHRHHFLPDFFCVLALKKIKCTYHMLTPNAFKGPTQHCCFPWHFPPQLKVWQLTLVPIWMH